MECQVNVISQSELDIGGRETCVTCITSVSDSDYTDVSGHDH